MRPNKEGQHVSCPSSGSVYHIYTLGYSGSLIPHRQSRRNQGSDFEKEVNRNSVKGESREWWLDPFLINPPCKQNVMKKTSLMSRGTGGRTVTRDS